MAQSTAKNTKNLPFRDNYARKKEGKSQDCKSARDEGKGRKKEEEKRKEEKAGKEKVKEEK